MKNRYFASWMFCTDPDPLVRGSDPRIRICIRILTKMSRIRNTASGHYVPTWLIYLSFCRPNPLQYFLVPDLEVENGEEEVEEEEEESGEEEEEEEEEEGGNVVVMDEEEEGGEDEDGEASAVQEGS